MAILINTCTPAINHAMLSKQFLLISFLARVSKRERQRCEKMFRTRREMQIKMGEGVEK